MVSKIAIITGASSGIGRATAIALYKAGWNVVLTARRQAELEETSQLCAQASSSAGSTSQSLVVAGDVTQESFVKELFVKAVDRFGRVDMLFNNAGTVMPQVPIEELPLETFTQVINVNLIGAFLCTREAVKLFKSQVPMGGRIINNGSLSAHVPRPHSSPYTCSKHALTGLTKCTALDGRAFDITCTQIDIGNALTEISVRHANVGAIQPDGRLVVEATFDVGYVADSVVYIANLPLDVQVLEMNIMAAKAPYVGRG